MSKFVLSNNKFVLSNGKFVMGEGAGPTTHTITANFTKLNGHSYPYYTFNVYSGPSAEGPWEFVTSDGSSGPFDFQVNSGYVKISDLDGKESISTTGGAA